MDKRFSKILKVSGPTLLLALLVVLVAAAPVLALPNDNASDNAVAATADNATSDNGNSGEAHAAAPGQSATTNSNAPADAGNSASAPGHADGSTSVTSSSSADHSQGNSGTSGNHNQPQPKSNADDNGTGANKPGPYDSTRDGGPSQNGNNGGEATGRPCEGCVGKADNKNPPGQVGNTKDNGYECDGNNGIGGRNGQKRSNPAHTGCKPPPPPPQLDCTGDTNPNNNQSCNPVVDCTGDTDPSNNDACNPVIPPEDPEEEPTNVLGIRFNRPNLKFAPNAVLGDRFGAPEGAVLPFTGGSVVPFVVIALSMIVTGGVAATRSKK